MYRKSDLQFLQDLYDRPSNDIAVIYGRVSVGVSELVRDFARDKESLYYRSTPLTHKSQLEQFIFELHEQTKVPIFPDDNNKRLLDFFVNNHTYKKVIVLDDFQYIIRSNPTFINFLSDMLFEHFEAGSVMFLLVTDDVKWVETDMIGLIGSKSSEISAVNKIKGFSFAEFGDCFADMALDEKIRIYSVLGGNSLYYNDIGDDTDAAAVIRRWLAKWNDMEAGSDIYLPRDIRDPVIYNTLLVNIASGSGKLNDLHTSMNMDRGKLSVYLKTLENNDIIEKLKGATVGDINCVKKGTYRIKDNTVRFYYRYVFPRLSSLRVYGEDRFYKRFIENELSAHIEGIYPRLCMEYIVGLQRKGRLNFIVDSVEEYFDKSEAVDFVIIVKGVSIIACACNYKHSAMKYEQLERVRESIRRNKLMCENIWLFSESGFDDKLVSCAASDPGVKLLALSDETPR